MLAQDTEIETGPDGSTVPIQNIRTGDRIFNPLSNSMHEVLDIKSRNAMFGKAPSEPCRDSLHPVKLRRAAVDGKRPDIDLITSPAQRIFVDQTPDGPFASLSVETASQQVANGKASVETCRSVCYYAVFTAEGYPLSANGMLVLSYSPL